MGSNIIFATLIAFLLLFFPSLSYSGNEDPSIHFIDAEEGDSILVKTPNGKAILVDAGNPISGFRICEYLKKNDIDMIDHLIFTHHDLDHIGGAFYLLQSLEAKNVYDNAQDLGLFASSSDIYRWYGELVRGSRNYKTLKAGDCLEIDGVLLKILWPSDVLQSSNFNTNSIVLMVEYNGARCLLAGDITAECEDKLIRQGQDLRADILKVAHHGAGDATSYAFLKAVSPKIAIVSVNASNVRGYPSNAVIGRLTEMGIRVYRTDTDGDILWGSRGEGEVVSCSR